MSESYVGEDSLHVSRYRSLSPVCRVIHVVFTVLGLSLSIIYLFRLTPLGYVIPDIGYFACLLTLFLPQVFLIFPASNSAPQNKIPWYDMMAFLVSMAGFLYVFINCDKIFLEGWSVDPPLLGFVLGIFTWFLVLEAIRRTSGTVMSVVILVFSIYPLFAHFLPGVFFGATYRFERILGFHYMGGQSMLGLPTRVFGQILIGYIVFGVCLQTVGGSKFFIDFAMATLGGIRGGAAKVSILSSAMFASLSGSAVANVLVTGAFTIPAMKKSGYPGYYAAAVEATASTAGVLTPPVMGTTAFIMADFLDVPYRVVVMGAAIPALLYYISLYAQSDFYAAKVGLKGLPRAELPSLRATLKFGWIYFIAVAILIYYIFVRMLEEQAPFYSMAVLFLVAMFRKETRLKPINFVHFLESSGKTLCELIGLMVGVGMIIGSVTLTGLSQGFASEISQMAGGITFLLLLMGAVASIIMGMGMTISACYIFLAILLAPALVENGLNPLGVHLFLVYWGMLSYITPPVALAVFAAKGIAGTPLFKTGFQAMRLSIVAYVIPFFFVYNPALVFQGALLNVFLATCSAILGTVVLASGIEGYGISIGVLGWPIRISLVICGLLLVIPELITSLIGIVVVALVISLLLLSKRRFNIRHPQ
jgi:TRAP transporter 4TM/12TM fusion protein